MPLESDMGPGDRNVGPGFTNQACADSLMDARSPLSILLYFYPYELNRSQRSINIRGCQKTRYCKETLGTVYKDQCLKKKEIHCKGGGGV